MISVPVIVVNCQLNVVYQLSGS
uniref:Uncharacterized protein n=1 Tax=Rhizophora mucronata TaxID=61149 RepID=A0A2P2P543_RHIMU